MISDYGLTRYDVYMGTSSTNQNQQNSNAANSSQHESQISAGNGNQIPDTYTVKAGDSLWGISQTYGTTVNNLKQINNLSSNVIYVGQVLKLKQQSASLSNQTSASATDTYTVQSGDTLWGIANTHDTTVNNLKQINDLTSDTIYVGQVLKLTQQSTTQQASSKPSQSNSSDFYTVKAGDSLWKIAMGNDLTVDHLKQMNNLTTNTIYVGQQLRIKEGQINSQPSQSNSQANQSNQNVGTYTVKAGDTLWGIANDHDTTVSALKQNNHLSSDTIYVGQVLSLGQASSTSSHSQSTASTQLSTSDGTYTVKSGDTLWSIANANDMTVAQLKQKNDLSNDTIYVGQTLKVSSAKLTSTTSTVSATYTVKSGDSLWKIASVNGTTVNQLKSLNNLSSDLIYAGQQLKLR